MAFLALCSFFFILQYSRFLLKKSSSDSPGMRFGGAKEFVDTGWVEHVRLWRSGQGIFMGLRTVPCGVWPCGSMGWSLILDKGLSGGFKVGRVVALVDIHSWQTDEVFWHLGMMYGEPNSALTLSLLNEQEISARVSSEWPSLMAEGWVSAAKWEVDGVCWRAGFGLRPLTVLVTTTAGAWKNKQNKPWTNTPITCTHLGLWRH